VTKGQIGETTGTNNTYHRRSIALTRGTNSTRLTDRWLRPEEQMHRPVGTTAQPEWDKW